VTSRSSSEATSSAQVTISVLVLAGKRGDAVGALEQLLERYERKQNLVRAERVRVRLTEVELSESAIERAYARIVWAPIDRLVNVEPRTSKEPAHESPAPPGDRGPARDLPAPSAGSIARRFDA
jgi:hypothetical protein